MKGIYVAAIAVAAFLSGCSVLNADSKASKPQPSAAEVKVPQLAPADSVVAGVESPDLAAQAPETSRPQKVRHRSHLYGQLSGEWTIVKAGKTEIPYEDEMPYLFFDEKQWTFYASNGCNILNGKFTYDGDFDIRFDSVISTMKYCPDVQFEQEINSVLSDGKVVTAKIEQSGRETFLTLSNSQGKTLMRLRRHNLDFLNGQWDVTRIEDTDVKDSGVNIFLDIAERKAHGNTGCNYFNGTIEIDPFHPSAIAFRNMAVTMRACPNLDTEMKFLVALEQVTQLKTSGNNTLHLLDRQGRTILTLRRVED